MKRRTFLSAALTTGMIGAAISAGVLLPRRVLAAWPESAFVAKTPDEALQLLLGTKAHQESAEIKLTTPEIAENGAVVPITITTTLPVESIVILVPKNPSSLVCSLSFAGGFAGEIATRIKMGETSDVIAVVKSGGRLYSTRKPVKVTIGGCGG